MSSSSFLTLFYWLLPVLTTLFPTTLMVFILLPFLGSTKNIPGKSCMDIKQHTNTTISKEYWIKPIPTATPFLVYCEMELYEGGWTLVYRYTFTNYIYFYGSNNSVTPRPNWPAPEANVDISTVPPLKDTFGAIQFHFWQFIGHEFFIR